MPRSSKMQFVYVRLNLFITGTCVLFPACVCACMQSMSTSRWFVICSATMETPQRCFSNTTLELEAQNLSVVTVQRWMISEQWLKLVHELRRSVKGLKHDDYHSLSLSLSLSRLSPSPLPSVSLSQTCRHDSKYKTRPIHRKEHGKFHNIALILCTPKCEWLILMTCKHHTGVPCFPSRLCQWTSWTLGSCSNHIGWLAPITVWLQLCWWCRCVTILCIHDRVLAASIKCYTWSK